MQNDNVNCLKENSSLKSLTHCCNNISNEGDMTILETVRENPSLTSLDLGRNDIRYLKLGTLVEVLKIKLNLDITKFGWVSKLENSGALAIADVLKVKTRELLLLLKH